MSRWVGLGVNQLATLRDTVLLGALDIRATPYGAIANGSDAGAAIRAAATQALATGGTVLIPAGTFTVSTYANGGTAIAITGNGSNRIVIEGLGPEVSTIKLTSGANRNLFSFRGLASVTLRNLTLECQGSLQSGGSAVYFNAVSNLPNARVTLENVTILQPFGIGLFFDGDNSDISLKGLRILTPGSHGVGFSGSTAPTKVVTGITKANPGVVTVASHGFVTGDRVTLASVGGMTEVNGNQYLITVLSANTFSLQHYSSGANIDTTGYTTYTSGGTAALEIYSKNIRISDVHVLNPADAGLNFSSTRYVTVDNLICIHDGTGGVHNTGYGGIRCTNDGSQISATNIYVKGMARGLFTKDVKGATFSNFNLINCGSQGILVQGDSGDTARVSFSNGTIFNPGQIASAGEGIRVDKVDYVTFNGINIGSDDSKMLYGVRETLTNSNVKYRGVNPYGAVTANWSLIQGDVDPSTVFTWATKPVAGVAGREITISGVGAGVWRDNGTRWLPVNGRVVIATLDAASSNIANTETIVKQVLLPAGLLQTGDRLRFRLAISKSGATDTGTLSIRVGTLGTTSDTRVFNGSTMLGAANRSGGIDLDIRVDSATAMSVLPNSGSTATSVGYSSVVSAATAAAVTVTDASANALYVNVSIASSSTNDTVSLRDAQIELVASVN